MIVSMLFTIFDRASAAWIRGEATVDRQRSARLSLELLSRSLSQAFITTTATDRVVFAGSTNWVYCAAPSAPIPDLVSDLAEYGYVYNSSSDSITRYASDPTRKNETDGTWKANGRFDAATPSPGALTNLATSSLLAEGVVGFQIRYYDASGNGVFSWDSGAAGPQYGTLPALVEIAMVSVDGRTAAHLPASDPARANAIAQHGRTNTMVVHLLHAQ
ncbi:MAG: hypothetical protein IT578_07575 [Verrucomicrobiae bacterium]|nr:hypothetical protein [Verrucomicrobiae bacterium]